MRYSVPRKSRRVPLALPVHLKLEEFPDPVTEGIVDLSLGGMRVSVARPSEEGSLVAFEFSIGDSLIEGTGEIVWAGPEAIDESSSPGMGIRFRYLSPGSRERIFRLVQWYAGQKQELSGEEVAAAAAVSLKPPAAPGRPAGIAETAPATEVVVEEPVTAAGSFLSPEGNPFSFADLAESDEPAPSQVLPPEDLEGEEALSSFPPAPISPARPAAAPLPPAPSAPASQPLRPEPAPPAPAAPAGPQGLAPPPPAPPPAPPVRSTPPAAAAAGDRAVPAEAPAPAGRTARASDYTATYSDLHETTLYPEEKGSDRRRLLLLLTILLLLMAATAFLLRDAIFSWIDGGSPEPAAVAQEAGERAETPDPAPSGSGAEVVAEAGVEGEAGETGELPAAAEPSLPAAGEAAPEELGAEPPAGAPQPPATEPVSPARPASRVERISWQAAGNTTTVVIEADGAMPPSAYSSLFFEGSQPRLLIRIRGIQESYDQLLIEVGNRQLARVRTGLHQTPGGPELHVVLDLGGPGVRLAGEVEGTGKGLRLALQGP